VRADDPRCSARCARDGDPGAQPRRDLDRSPRHPGHSRRHPPLGLKRACGAPLSGTGVFAQPAVSCLHISMVFGSTARPAALEWACPGRLTAEDYSMMLCAFRVVGLTLALISWPSHPQLSEDVEPQIKGGQSIALEGRWSVFRMGDAPTKSKCL